jgi:hypothetical protein
MSERSFSHKQAETERQWDFGLKPRRLSVGSSPAAYGGLKPDAVNFVICGGLIFGFAIGLRRMLAPDGRGSTWGPRLIAALGLALVVAGVFVTDPAQGYPLGTPSGPAVTTSWHGAIHAFAGVMIFVVLLPIACYVMASYFANAVNSRGWTLYSIATGLVIWASFTAYIVAGLHNGPAGFYERIAIIAGWGWIALLALRYLPQTRPSASAAQATGALSQRPDH